jgi:spore germination protein YaaH
MDTERGFVTWHLHSWFRQIPRQMLLTPLAALLAFGCLQAAQKPKPAAKTPSKLPLAVRKARWHVLGTRPLGMYYYTTDSRGLESLGKYSAKMTLLAPQCFWVDAEGFVHGQVPPEILQMSREANLPLMPLLINPGFNRPLAHTLLSSSKAQERAAMYMAYLAQRDGYVGWQLDLEFVDPADKARYTRFVERVAARLHRDGRLLTVAVVPRFSDAYPGTDGTGAFRTGEWGAPYDFRALGRVADLVTLMTYDHHHTQGPPGPVAGYDWVKAALDYAVRRVPRQKLLLGIPFYGREWVSNGEKATSRTLSFADAAVRTAQPGVEPRWHERWRTPWFEFRDASGLHTGWYEDKFWSLTAILPERPPTDSKQRTGKAKAAASHARTGSPSR